MHDAVRRSRKPVLLFGNALGDHILNRPAVIALARLFEGRLTLCARPGMAQAFFPDATFSRLLELPMEAASPGRLFDAGSAARLIGGTDLFLSLNPWHSSSVNCLLDLLSPVDSYGFHARFRHPLPLDFDKHSSDLAFDLVKALSPEARLEDCAPALPLPAETQSFIRSIRSPLTRGQRLLVIHAETKAEKSWHSAGWATVIRGFTRSHPNYAVAVLGERDAMIDLKGLSNRAFAVTGLAMPYAIGVIAAASLFAGIDSFPLHVADSLRIPSLGLFGPTSSREFGCRLTHFSHHIDMRGSLNEMSPRRVLQELRRLADQAEGIRPDPRVFE